MLTAYIRAAMRQAGCKIVEDYGSFYGEIPAVPGIWANAKTLEACREELESVLEGWLLLSVADHSPIPEIRGTRIEIREASPDQCVNVYPAAGAAVTCTGVPLA